MIKKLLAFLILSFLLSKNVFALTVSCKNFYKGEVITNETFDLSTGSKWKAKFTDTHIYWRQFKITNDSEKKGVVFYNELDRYNGFLRTRVTEEYYLTVLLKGNRSNKGAPVDFVLDGECKKVTKKKF